MKKAKSAALAKKNGVDQVLKNNLWTWGYSLIISLISTVRRNLFEIMLLVVVTDFDLIKLQLS